MSNSNLISKSEAQFKLRNIVAKLQLAISAAREGDWRICFDNAYEAGDDLDILLPHLDEAATMMSERPKKEPEPPGSLKYGVPPGTPAKRERVGGMGYAGSSRNHSGPVIDVDVSPSTSHKPVFKKRADAFLPPPPIIGLPKPPAPPTPPIVTPPPPPKVGDWVQWESLGCLQFPKPMQIASFSEDGKWAFFAHSATGAPVDQLIHAEPEE